MQRILESISHVFQKTAVDRRVQPIKPELSAYLKLPDPKAVIRKRTTNDWAVEKIVRKVLVPGTIDDAILIKVQGPAELQNIVRHSMLNFVRNPMFKVHTSQSVKQHAQSTFVEEAKL